MFHWTPWCHGAGNFCAVDSRSSKLLNCYSIYACPATRWVLVCRCRHCSDKTTRFLTIHFVIGIKKDDERGQARVTGVWGACYAMGTSFGPLIADLLMELQVWELLPLAIWAPPCGSVNSELCSCHNAAAVLMFQFSVPRWTSFAEKKTGLAIPRLQQVGLVWTTQLVFRSSIASMARSQFSRVLVLCIALCFGSIFCPFATTRARLFNKSHITEVLRERTIFIF